MDSLKGKAAIVTGANRGIGRAAAEALAQAGANVLLTARSCGQVGASAQAIRDAGGAALAHICDVSDYEQVAASIETCKKEFGRVDILVNNAGVIEPISALHEADPAAWNTLVDVNVKGVFHGLRAALPEMVSQGSGVIVNISSGAATSPLEGWSAYCASKAAVLMLTRAAHAEYADKGIRVVGLSPGTVATDMQRVIKSSGVNPVSKLEWSDHIPPEWAGRAVAYLCTPEASDYDGDDMRLREQEARRRVGLI